MILLLSLSLAGQMDNESARTIAEYITRQQSKICHMHVVQAAQYILAEMTLAGKGFAYFVDPYASGSTACVKDEDIPQGLVQIFNTIAEGTVTIEPRDVSKFLNDALERYYASALWPVTEEVDDSESPVKADEDGEEEGEVAGVSGLCKGSESTFTAEMGGILLIPAPSGVNGNALAGLSDRNSTYPSEMSVNGEFVPDDVQESTLLQESDPAALHRYFLVKGEMLMQLFQFCPLCGHKLSETQLDAIGTAPVVRFICKQCCVGERRVQLWEGQQRTTVQSRKGRH
ncbi:unnamed protein product [Haemonchus placei]|uniref:ClpX-type ZB domain-containing protein n=1 Tax=Haemonchus placei TaxID=6290 RepID=A0A0N4WWY8_HAEPC|nr:unnamed protein product [Haemonchus placei]